MKFILNYIMYSSISYGTHVLYFSCIIYELRGWIFQKFNLTVVFLIPVVHIPINKIGELPCMLFYLKKNNDMIGE